MVDVQVLPSAVRGGKHFVVEGQFEDQREGVGDVDYPGRILVRDIPRTPPISC